MKRASLMTKAEIEDLIANHTEGHEAGGDARWNAQAVQCIRELQLVSTTMSDAAAHLALKLSRMGGGRFDALRKAALDVYNAEGMGRDAMASNAAYVEALQEPMGGLHAALLAIKRAEEAARVAPAQVLEFPAEDWRAEVVSGLTLSGYAEWVEQRRSPQQPEFAPSSASP